jgi:hypothetical protein
MKTISEMPRNTNQQAIALLKRRLADAEAGRIVHVGLVTSSPDGNVHVETAGLPGVLVAGAAQLQRQMLETLFPPVRQVAPMSSVKLSS